MTTPIIDRLTVLGDFGFNEHRAQQDEVSEFRVNDVSVNAHHSQPSRNGYWLVRHDPNLAGELVHLHRETHRWIEGFDDLAMGQSPGTSASITHRINLTMNTYTTLSVFDQAAAVESLPPVPGTQQVELRATGTDGRVLRVVNRQKAKRRAK